MEEDPILDAEREQEIIRATEDGGAQHMLEIQEREKNVAHKIIMKNIFGDSESESEGGEPDELLVEHEEFGVALDGVKYPRPEGKLHMVKLPGMLSIASKPYDPETYAEEREEGGMQQPETTVRWRVSNDEELGQFCAQTNARIVEWSDGTWQMVLGDDHYDVKFADIQDEHRYIFVSQSQFQESHGQLTQRLSMQPVSTKSSIHKRYSSRVQQKHKKGRGIQKIATLTDPEREKQKLERMEGDRIRDKEKREKEKRRVRRKGTRMSEAFLEEDHGEGESLDQIREDALQSASSGRALIDSEEEEGGEEAVVEGNDNWLSVPMTRATQARMQVLMEDDDDL